MEGNHWHPGKTPCVPPVTQRLVSEDADGVPLPIRRPTLIIWHMRTCVACRNAAGFFRKLEEEAGDFQVLRIEANREYIQRYPHIQTLPLFDVIRPAPGTSSPYGADTQLLTVRNHERHLLRSVFPRAFDR
jgi:hypothetical protein